MRPAEPSDLPLLGGVEAAADQLFIDRFQPETWDQPATGEWRAAQPGFLLVAGRPPVGIANVLVEVGSAHLEMLAVHPDHGRRGIGTALLEACCAAAAAGGHEELTLTTFANVPWNAPYYLRLGFAVVEEPTGVLARHLEHEQLLERYDARVGMVRRLGR
ncbi:GNAT family N-acetyltransferase [Nocardioides speluncae]|uniref:GNAT family N-acetyltransferase n=1 Tax=Nocardioides speluncae TaxID=2670337 RepID=UPI000D68DE49|nr:GNAT family N-acetyltransferase [Nocardioides speluncae]